MIARASVALPEVHEEQEDVACPMCGMRSSRVVSYGRDRLFARPGKYRILACSICELRYVSPRPTLAALAAHYPSTYFIYQSADALPPWTRWLARTFSTLRWQASLMRLERVSGRLRPDLKVVDVGCGLNDYLASLQTLRGVEGIGVDFKPELAQYTRERLHMMVHSGTLLDAGFGDAEFDVVAMNEYLEQRR